MDNIPDNIQNLPEIVETEKTQLSKEEKQIARIKAKVISLVEDATECVHQAVKGENYRGKKITRSQLFAASPIVARFAPEIDKTASGQVHLHLNIPRPKPQVIEATVVEQKEIAPKENKEGLSTVKGSPNT